MQTAANNGHRLYRTNVPGMDLTAQVQPHVRFTEVRRLKGDRMLCTNVFSAGMFAQRGAYVIHDPNTAAVATATASTQLIWTFNATPPFAQPHLSPHVALQPLIIHNERSIFTRRVDQKRYELTDHLGNVRAVVSDKLIADYDLTTDAAPTNLRAKLISRSDYYPFGSLLPGKNYSSSNYRYGLNGQEKDDEVYGATGTSTTAEFWQYDTRTGRRWNLDPKPNPSISQYAAFELNPILYSDPDGDSVKFGGFRDRLNSFFAKTFNKGYRADFKGWKESTDTYTISKDNLSGSRLVDTDPAYSSTGAFGDNYNVCYGRGFGIEDMSSKGLRATASTLAIPFEIGFSVGKFGIGGIAGIGIAFHNIFSADDIGWGMANRVSFHNGVNELSWGLGDYNRYTMFGQPIEKSPFGASKIHPQDGLIGLRVGQGRRMPAAFIDILGEVRVKSYQYHMHINIIDERTRSRKTKGDDATIDFRNRVPGR